MSTSHIEICRDRWYEHWPTCPHCNQQKDLPDWCEQGNVLFHEYAAAISADRDCEHLVATDIPDDGFLALGTPEREDQEKRFGENQEPTEDENI